MKQRRKKRSAIVPAVVFATVVTAGCLPAISGCDDTMKLTVAFSVAADFATRFSVAADFAVPFSVADLGFRD